MAKYEPGTKVRVVKYGDQAVPDGDDDIIGQVGVITEVGGAERLHRVFFDLPGDDRNGYWLFFSDEIVEVVA
jgi:hypothetical protein